MRVCVYPHRGQQWLKRHNEIKARRLLFLLLLPYDNSRRSMGKKNILKSISKGSNNRRHSFLSSSLLFNVVYPISVTQSDAWNSRSWWRWRSRIAVSLGPCFLSFYFTRRKQCRQNKQRRRRRRRRVRQDCNSLKNERICSVCLFVCIRACVYVNVWCLFYSI